MEFALCLLSTALYKFLSDLFSILYYTDMMKSQLIPDQLPGEYTGLKVTHLAQ